MLYREVIAFCFEICTQYINALCGQNVEFLNVKPGGIWNNHWVLKGFATKGMENVWFFRTNYNFRMI